MTALARRQEKSGTAAPPQFTSGRMSASNLVAEVKGEPCDPIEVEPEAMKSPKRAEQSAVNDDGSPRKQLRKEQEPSNRELLELVKGWQRRSEGRFNQFLERAHDNDRRTTLMAHAMGAWLDVLGSGLEHLATATEETKNESDRFEETA